MEAHISNAGVIIFWPFLNTFFERVNLVHEGTFIDVAAQQRGAYLLQYLVYGAIDFPEHQLLLNKLMVGLSPTHALVPLNQITAEEKEVADSLMDGLRSNWEKVQNSSDAAIRESFLQRDGILSFNPERLKLTVEQKGIDVLLDFIPWDIRRIDLPWINNSIEVFWR
ncbi:contractile injection system tape measure protein [uncultured Kriegella sp.]|uniref:contractile injection system tape measure protein n=1 Tax=uncultured Kriegella sp. TaxID=1798910 RepID=UPI0030D7D97C|tara:strand:- start:45679 stop:46179 length:501 start_codon:yes stop_codon:yes gene_type:complete